VKKEVEMRRKENRKAKLYHVVAVFVLLGMALTTVSYYGNKVQSGSRAYIGGESEWSKAQKESSINLMHYLRTEDERDYRNYLKSLQVIFGDRISRRELFLPTPDLKRVRRGFIQGNNHPDDVDEMIWLLRNFSSLDEIENALNIWASADQIVDESRVLAEDIHRKVQTGSLDVVSKEEYSNQIIEINERLTVAGQKFSEAMSSAARRFGEVIFWVNVFLSTTFTFFVAFYTVSYLRRLRGVNAKLFRSENKFRNVLDHSQDVIYQINIGSEKYDYMSSSVKDMLGFDAEEIMGGGPEMILQRVHPDDVDRMQERQEQNQSGNVEQTMVQDSEFRVKRADGTYIWVNNKRSIVHDSDGNPVSIVGNVRDISVHKHQMEKLDQSLNEKQTLLAEIHHRVKNNLAIVSSLIGLQKDEVDVSLKPAFENVQSRIKSIALIHEKLYEKTIFSEVELADYLRELSEMISKTYSSEENRITINLDVDDVKVDMISAVPVGLICNELLTNCFKHAFQDRKKGTITISLKDLGCYVEVSVSDTGAGLPEEFSLEKTQSLGVTLLQALTEQIKGELKAISDRGSKFILTFPVSGEAKNKAKKKTGS